MSNKLTALSSYSSTVAWVVQLLNDVGSPSWPRCILKNCAPRLSSTIVAVRYTDVEANRLTIA